MRMKRPFLLVQLSDPHVGADWGDGHSVAMLTAAVECVRALEPNPDSVLISGDLADHANVQALLDFGAKEIEVSKGPSRLRRAHVRRR
jgi:3',5'-cyclic AMP phosphodiesterase CpdA